MAMIELTACHLCIFKTFFIYYYYYYSIKTKYFLFTVLSLCFQMAKLLVLIQPDFVLFSLLCLPYEIYF